MARPSTLERRLVMVLNPSQNRRGMTRKSFLTYTVTLFVLALAFAICRAAEEPSPALKEVRQWAKQYGLEAQDIEPTTLETQNGWRNLPFTLSKAEEADAKACVKIANSTRSSHNGVTEFSMPQVRAQLENLIKTRPDDFYAHWLLALWHRDFGDAIESKRQLDAAYKNAPAIIVQRYQYADGSPCANKRINSFALECNRVVNGAIDPSLQLSYPNLKTDANGCIYLPVYNTVYRTNDMASPPGYDAKYPRLGWFQISAKVGLLPTAIVTEISGGFVSTAPAGALPVTSVTFPDNNTVSLIAIGRWPDPANTFWLPDGSPAKGSYKTGKPSIASLSEENNNVRRILFRFARPPAKDDNLMFMFSVPVHQHFFDKSDVLFFGLPTQPKTLAIRVGMARGPWKIAGKYDPATAKTTGTLPEGFSFFIDTKDRYFTKDDGAKIAIAYPESSLQVRVRAFDKANREVLSNSSAMSSQNVPDGVHHENHYHFKEPPSKIQCFQLETREYQWREFSNIAMEAAGARVNK